MSIVHQIGAERYERSKSKLRALLPLGNSHIRALKKPIEKFHQRHIQSYIFIHINKCGGTSIERSLGIPLLNHDTLEERIAVLGEKKASERFRFAFVRNPYDRLLSAFFFAHSRTTIHQLPAEDQRELFNAWSASRLANASSGHRNFMSQTQWVTHKGCVDMNFVGRFERFTQDYEYIRSRIPSARELPALKRRTKGEICPLRWWYGKELEELAVEAYANDFENFKYDWRLP